MGDPKDKVIADLAFNLGNYVYQFSSQNKAAADELIDIAMDDIDNLDVPLAVQVRAEIVRGYQSAAQMALSMAAIPLGIVKH